MPYTQLKFINSMLSHSVYLSNHTHLLRKNSNSFTSQTIIFHTYLSINIFFHITYRQHIEMNNNAYGVSESHNNKKNRVYKSNLRTRTTQANNMCFHRYINLYLRGRKKIHFINIFILMMSRVDICVSSAPHKRYN